MMRMNPGGWARRAFAGGALALGGLALTGCVPQGPSVPVSTPTSAAAETPSPTPTAVYTSPTGTEIPIYADEPVPPEVIEAAGAAATSAAEAHAASGTNSRPDAMAAVEAQVGDRPWVLVAPTWGSTSPDPAAATWLWFVAANGDPIPGNPFTSQDDAAAAAQAWIAGQADPAAWTLVVAPPAG